MPAFLKLLLRSFFILLVASYPFHSVFGRTQSAIQDSGQSVFYQDDIHKITARLDSMNPSEFFVPGLNQFQIVLVGGFLGELSSEYLEANENAIRLMGADHVLRIQPSSLHSVELNIDILRGQILAEFVKNKKPIILWGHSKGGIESLGLILKYPELVRDGIVKLVIPMQSPVAGCFGGTCASRGMVVSRAHGAFDGLHSLNSKAIDRVITKRLEQLDPETRAMLSAATVYVVSHQDPRKVDTILKIPAFTMWSLGMQNDSLVAEKSMSIKHFGHIIGRVIADHMQMVIVATKGIAHQLLKTGTLHQVYALSYLLMSSSVKQIEVQGQSAMTGHTLSTHRLNSDSLNSCISLFNGR